MGHRSPWLPVVPLHGGQPAVLTVSALLVPGRFAIEGLAWVRTSGGGRLGGLRTRAPVAGHVALLGMAACTGGASLQHSL